MNATINKEQHEVIYIDYGYGNIPHQVYTIETETGYTKSWDFFANNGQKDDIRFYNSGSGYNKIEIPAPRWADKNKGKYWISDGVKLKGKSNGIKLQKPIRVKGYNFKTSSINPFKVSEETNCREFCEECGHESTEFCDDHKYEDKQGNSRWKHNDEYCD